MPLKGSRITPLVNRLSLFSLHDDLRHELFNMAAHAYRIVGVCDTDRFRLLVVTFLVFAYPVLRREVSPLSAFDAQISVR